MTGQIPDEVRYDGCGYALTAFDGGDLFDPAAHGVQPGPLSTACWRGFICTYSIEQGALILDRVEIGRSREQREVPTLFGIHARTAGAKAFHPGALVFQQLAAPVDFSGRLLIAAGSAKVGYLNMGFRPAWLYHRVYELVFQQGRLTSAHDRSAELAGVRRLLGSNGVKPRSDEPTGAWIERAFSLTFDYSWPSNG